MDIHQIREEIVNLSTEQRYALIFNLLESDIIDFTRIADVYVEHLRAVRNRAKCKESELAAMLSIAWRPFYHPEANGFAKARSALLLENWVPHQILLEILEDVGIQTLINQKEYLRINNIEVSDELIKLKKVNQNESIK